MEKELEKVTGVVEAVNKRYTGSLLVNSRWYSFAKGVATRTAVKGDNVVLTLEPWVAKGKSGLNITAVDVLAVPHVSQQDTSKGIDLRTKPTQSSNEMTKDEWRDKDRSQLVGGRSHDAVELVTASLTTMTPMPKVLELYKEALQSVLEIAKEIR